jgi:hypothetical protein
VSGRLVAAGLSSKVSMSRSLRGRETGMSDSSEIGHVATFSAELEI